MAKSKLVEINEKIADGVAGGYKKIEDGVVGGFNKITDKFVDSFLTKDGETVEEAKARLAQEQKERATVHNFETKNKQNANKKSI